MYNNTLRVYGEQLAEVQTIPQNATTAGNKGPVRSKNTMGAMELAIIAETQVSIAIGKTITISLSDCATEGGSYNSMPQKFVKLHAAAKTYKAGEVIGVLPVPSTADSFIKCSLTTDDAVATGTVSVVPTYLPR